MKKQNVTTALYRQSANIAQCFYELEPKMTDLLRQYINQLSLAKAISSTGKRSGLLFVRGLCEAFHAKTSWPMLYCTNIIAANIGRIVVGRIHNRYIEKSYEENDGFSTYYLNENNTIQNTLLEDWFYIKVHNHSLTKKAEPKEIMQDIAVKVLVLPYNIYCSAQKYFNAVTPKDLGADIAGTIGSIGGATMITLIVGPPGLLGLPAYFATEGAMKSLCAFLGKKITVSALEKKAFIPISEIAKQKHAEFLTDLKMQATELDGGNEVAQKPPESTKQLEMLANQNVLMFNNYTKKEQAQPDYLEPKVSTTPSMKLCQ